jgi:hypothetical protein
MTAFWRLAYRTLDPWLARLQVVLIRADCRLSYSIHRLECEICQLAIIPERRCLHWHIEQQEFDRQIQTARRLNAELANG